MYTNDLSISVLDDHMMDTRIYDKDIQERLSKLGMELHISSIDHVPRGEMLLPVHLSFLSRHIIKIYEIILYQMHAFSIA